MATQEASFAQGRSELEVKLAENRKMHKKVLTEMVASRDPLRNEAGEFSSVGSIFASELKKARQDFSGASTETASYRDR